MFLLKATSSKVRGANADSVFGKIISPYTLPASIHLETMWVDFISICMCHYITFTLVQVYVYMFGDGQSPDNQKFSASWVTIFS